MPRRSFLMAHAGPKGLSFVGEKQSRRLENAVFA